MAGKISQIGVVLSLASPVVMASNQTVSLDQLLDMSLDSLANIEIVSVSRSMQQRSQAPAMVYVVSSDQIRLRGYRSLTQALGDLPGIQLRDIQGFNSYLFMRGAPNQNNLVQLLVDGVEINELNSGGFYAGNQFNMDNIDRIEVVYGPSSVLYGTNAMSGVINVITRSPEQAAAQGSYVKATVGSFDTQELSYRVGGYNAYTGAGYTFAVQSNDTSKADLAGVAGDNNWSEQMENFERNLTLEGKWKSGNLTIGLLHQDKQASRSTNFTGADYLDYDTNWHIAFTNGWLRHDYAISSTINLQSELVMRDATVMDDTIGYIYKDSSATPGQQGYFRPNQMVGITEQLDMKLGEKLSVITGLSYEEENLANGFSRTSSSSQSEPAPTPLAPEMSKNHLVSYYAQAQYNISDNWGLSVGARQDESSSYGTVSTPKLALTYQSEKLTSKLLFGEAFRAPKPWDFTYGVGNPDLKPERVRSRELIAKYQFTPDFSSEWTIYNNEHYDSFTKGAVLDRWENQGTLMVEGSDISLNHRIGNAMAYFNYSYVDSRDADGQSVAEIANHMANFGMYLPMNEQWQLNLSANYLGERKNPKTITATGSDTIDEAVVVDANLNYKASQKLELQMKIENMLDEVYYHSSNRPVERYRQPQQTLLLTLYYEL